MEVLVGIILYLLPAIVALLKRHPKWLAIAAVNALTGWTIIGWIVAMVWAVRRPKASGSSGTAQAATVKYGEAPLVAKGAGGTMTFNGREVIINRKGALSFLIHGLAGEKSISINAVQAVQLRPARFGVRGYIQLSIMGGIENRGGAVGAAADENSVLFDTADQPAFEVMAETIKEAIHQKHQPVMMAAPVSQADEIAKLADLRDRGALTEEEFVAAKRALIADPKPN